MGDSTQSTFWMFLIIIIIYIVGMSLYTLVKKIQEKKKWKWLNMKPIDLILILIVAAILFFALKGTVKHFKGESSCCGGSVSDKVKVDDKNTNHYAYHITVNTSGLKCDGCKTKVENALNSKIGVYAIADYKNNIVKVHSKNELSDEEITKAIEGAGYKVNSITR